MKIVRSDDVLRTFAEAGVELLRAEDPLLHDLITKEYERQMDLSERERQELERSARSRRARADEARIGRVLLLLAEGEAYVGIQDKVDCAQAGSADPELDSEEADRGLDAMEYAALAQEARDASHDGRRGLEQAWHAAAPHGTLHAAYAALNNQLLQSTF